MSLHYSCHVPATTCPLLLMSAETYLDQEQEVRVLTLRSGTLTVLDVLLGDINTLMMVKCNMKWCVGESV